MDKTERREIFSEISNNKVKTYFLFLGFFVFIIVIAIALKYIFNFAGFGILTIAGIFAIIYGLFGYFVGDKIVLFTSGAHEADEKKYVFLHNVVEGLSISAGIPKPKVYIIEDKSPNAFATGRDPEHSSLAVTTGLLEIMNRQELEGVVAHEMSHIQNRDIQVMMVTSILFGIVSIVSDIALRVLIFGGGDDSDNKSVVGIIIAVVLLILAPLVAMMIQLAISRNREYLADSTGAKLTRYPKGLADALKKIAAAHEPVKNASKGTAHLYIANPLADGGLSGLFSTHPPIQERIKD
ncbi:MAG: M48 family metalloprotease [archaeon]|jgi:heat shock protein HtpX